MFSTARKTIATAAALAKVPGAAIERVETDVDHGSPYEAHVTRFDGTRREVLADADLAVTAVNTMTRSAPAEARRRLAPGRADEPAGAGAQTGPVARATGPGASGDQAQLGHGLVPRWASSFAAIRSCSASEAAAGLPLPPRSRQVAFENWYLP